MDSAYNGTAPAPLSERPVDQWNLHRGGTDALNQVLKIQQVCPVHTKQKIIRMEKVRAPLNSVPESHGSSLKQIQRSGCWILCRT